MSGYNKDFYKAYQRYLKEPQVREAHDYVFGLFDDDENGCYGDIIDLGCGQCNEFYHNYCRYYGAYYKGIDLHAYQGQSGDPIVVEGDYRNKRFLREQIDNNMTAFVSLFSSEVHAPFEENYKFYNWIFKTFPTIQAGLVSGLYHSNRTECNPMMANGNVIYQTLEGIQQPRRIGYTEKRVVMQVPSKLFGKHEVEVWKIFKRG